MISHETEVTGMATNSITKGAPESGRVTQSFGSLAQSRIGLAEAVRAKSVAALNRLLAHTMALRDLYKKAHWQTSGPVSTSFTCSLTNIMENRSVSWMYLRSGCSCLAVWPSRWPAIVLNQLMELTRAAGSIGIPGLYVTEDPGAMDAQARKGSLSLRFGLGWAKSHSLHTGQTPVMKYNRALMMAILHDRIQIARAVNATLISLDQAPSGYADFDRGVARKFVIAPHGMRGVGANSKG
jgi:threonine dehydrogenase-like Zn-dependent dehydrogenase